jgi:hypothetical protein
MNLNEEETRLYTDSEIDLLIDDISVIAIEAIERAAVEAARATALTLVEREAFAMREIQRWRSEAEMNLHAVQATKRVGFRNAVITGLVGLASGLVIGFAIK